MHGSSLVLCLLLAFPPLTDDQRVRLDTAFDGRDHQEEAFAALLENFAAAAAAGSGFGDEPVRLRPDLDTLVERPADFRGDLCRITGSLQQQTWLDAPFEEVSEWFVRDESGRPVLVYVAGLTPQTATRFRDGARVEVFARFYKRVDAVARDGELHRYPAFVGAAPRLRRSGGRSDLSLPVVVTGLTVAAAVVFLVAFVLARRAHRRGPRRVRTGAPAVEETVDGGPLPDDPADALAELKRRAGPEG